jgi:osmotically-inducible protein OsmY
VIQIRSLAILAVSFLALQGCVPAAVVGTTAGVAAAHDRRTFGSIIDDQNIELKAAAAIDTDSAIKSIVHINVTSMNGIVLLTGEAETLDARDAVLTHVREINGVRRITNEIRITEPSPFSARSEDSLITSAVKARFLVTKGLDPTRVKVVTENQAVYLMGLVTHAEGDLAADLAAGIDGVSRVVKIFEYID